MLVESILCLSLLLGPPTGELAEGPAPEEQDPKDASGLTTNPYADPDADPDAEPDPDAELDPAEQARVDAVLADATKALEDRAWLERNDQLIEVYVTQLDALANVGAQLDGCGRAVQAELRMGLALAYLKADGSCSQTGEVGEGEGEVEVEIEEGAADNLPMPVLECFEVASPGECSDRLLEEVAAFANEGQAGLEAPFSQAFGCPHAVAEMSVEQMFGTCMVGEYDEAIDRFEGRKGTNRRRDGGVWPVPRWASIAGVAGGAALVIGGAVMLGIDGKCPGGYDPVTQADQCPSVYKTGTGGAVLVSVGALVMVGMGTVLTVTEIQRKRQGKRRESALRRRIDRAEALTGLRLSIPRPSLKLRP